MGIEGIGARVARKEDRRFITGAGRYVDDMVVPGMKHAAFVRSPYAHAAIKGIDVSKAKAMPGVVDVLTGKQLKADGIGNLICGWMIHSKDGTPMKMGAWSPLAVDRVRYVGDAVAVVVADTKGQARDAAEAVLVDYEELPAVIDAVEALKTGAPQIHPEAEGNLIFDWEIGDSKAADEAIARAAHVTRVTIHNNRLVPNAMEPRAALGIYDRGDDHYTCWTTSQNPHVARLVLSAFYNVAPENKLRVIAPDVGGGFGSKIYIYPEEIVCLWASKKTNVPVKWVADRTESFLTDAHGRDHVSEVEMAFDADNRIIGLKVDTIANLGAYMSLFSSCVPTYLYATLLSGQYNIPAIHANVRTVYTNTAPVDAYRGAGRPEATYLLERTMEIAARELKVSPAELRRKNFIREFPHQTPVIMCYDAGDYDASLNAAMKAADWDGFPAHREEARRRGKLRGIGMANAIEISAGPAPAPMPESAEIKFDQTGGVTVSMGTHSHGQGHEITFAQIVADFLGLELSDVRVRYGDTDVVEFGVGTFGSRSVITGSNSLRISADRLIERGKKIAAVHFEADAGDIVFEAGQFSIAGTDRRIGIKDVAKLSYTLRDPSLGGQFGLSEKTIAAPKAATFPNGCHVCEVEIDPDTGVCQVLNYVVVDDVGRVVNPMLVKGQVHGGVVQGVGQILFEDIRYDEDGQLLTGSFMDYAMPRAAHFPAFVCKANEVLTPMNPLGVKGAGEAGTVGALAAAVNAIVDALSPYGIEHIDMPATPERIWRTIQDAKAAG